MSTYRSRESRYLFAVLLIAALGRTAVCGEPSQDEKDKAAIAAVRAKLEKPIAAEMVDMTVARALDLLAKRADVTLTLIGRQQRPAYQQHVTMTLENARAIDILDVICEGAALNYQIRPAEVRVSSVLEMTGRKVSFFAYALDDLLASVLDFPPPGGVLEPLFSNNSSSYAGVGKSAVTMTNLADMIRNRVRPESWDPALGTSIEERGKVLTVMQTEEVHALIGRLLAGLRARASRQVAIDVRALSIKSTEVDRIRRDVAGRKVSPMLFDDPAIAAIDKLVQDGAAAQLFRGSTLIFNTQLGLLHNLKSQSMVCDYEVSGDVLDPIVRFVNTGTVVSALPILSDDGSLVSLTLRVGHVAMAAPPESMVVQRGGLVPASAAGGGSVVSMKRRVKEKDDKKKEKPETKEEDTTSEYEIKTESSSGIMVPTIGPVQLQLPTLARSRLSQDLILPAGKFAAVSAPMSGPDGLAPGSEMLVLVRCQPLIVAAPEMEPDKKDVAVLPDGIKKTLDKRMTVSFLETPFQRAVEAFSNQAKVPLILDSAGLGERVKVPVTLDLKDANAEEALLVLLRAGDADVIAYNSLLLVTSRTKVGARRMSLRVFDVRDMTRKPGDYPGEYASGCMDVLPGPEFQIGGSPFAAPAADMTVGLNTADFAALLKDKIMAEEFAHPASSIEESGGKLVVVNTPEVLARIETVLSEMRKSARRPLLISARFAIVNSDALAAAAGAGGPSVLDAAAAAKVLDLIAQDPSRDLASARLVCFNGQRVSAFGGIESTYVRDYDVSGSMFDPVIASRLAGAVVDVKPLIMEGGGKDAAAQLMIETRLALSHADPKPAKLDLIAGVTEAQANESRPTLTSPPAPGRVQTPLNAAQEVRCTVRVGDGGAVLFRIPPPDWVQGEDAEGVRKGTRIGIILLQAQQQKDN